MPPIIKFYIISSTFFSCKITRYLIVLLIIPRYIYIYIKSALNLAEMQYFTNDKVSRSYIILLFILRFIYRASSSIVCLGNENVPPSTRGNLDSTKIPCCCQ